MKKFLVMFAVMFMLIFIGNSAQAYNYDVGIYPEGAMRGYLMTETVRVDRYNGTFSCTVVVYPNGKPYYIDYYFWSSGGYFYFRNSDGYSEAVNSYRTPVEYNIYRYVW